MNKTDIDKKNSIPQQLLNDARQIIETARSNAYMAINVAMVQRNWLLGKRIAEEELKGENRAEYGTRVIADLSNALQTEFGKGFTISNLYQYIQFYKTFPSIFYSLSEKSSELWNNREQNILYSVSIKSNCLLSWTHYRTLLQVEDDKARAWYEHETALQTWSVRTLQRNISSQYYHRMLQSQNKQAVKKEMKTLATPLQQDKLEFIKNPVVAEFLGLSPNRDFTESKLENSILTHIKDFLMEMGKGYAFVDRQHHIHTEKEDYYIDLVFYNFYLKCFVLIDLKTTKITHQDVGQMDMYIRMYDELKRPVGDNPTLGIILCADTDEDIARYSILKENEQLFASKYITYLPDKETLRIEIERQKTIFMLTQRENNE